MQLNKIQCFGTGALIDIFLQFPTNLFVARNIPPLVLSQDQHI